MDYNGQAPTTKAFFAMVQNKLHFAIHGHTAAELVKLRADNSWLKIRTVEGLSGLAEIYPNICQGKLAADEGVIVALTPSC
jgi:hypothetical protein